MLLSNSTFQEITILALIQRRYLCHFTTILLVLLTASCNEPGSGDNPGDGNKPERKKEFITKWKTDNPGNTNDRQIRIHVNLDDFNGQYNYNVDWGDGNTDTNIQEDIIHSYNEIGTYQVTITGDFPQLYFVDKYSDHDKLVSVESWGGNKWLSMKNFFYNCRNLSLNATDTPDLSLVTDMSYMLSGAVYFDQDISNWDVSNVENMTGLFYDSYSFNQDISNWNVSKVHTMDLMFADARLFNQSLNNWDLSSVTSMHHMFSRAFSYNQSMQNWDVSSVQDMSYMFSYAKSFDQEISNWDVSAVTDMYYMFGSAEVFNQDISSWDVSNVSSVRNMFDRAQNFNQDLGNWKLTSARTLHSMFYGVTLDTPNYDSILIKWSQHMNLNSTPFHAGRSRYSAAAVNARNTLINVKGWTITDGGMAP
jgi:surface protein